MANRRRLRKRLVIGSASVLILVVAWWMYPSIIYSQSRIERLVSTGTPLGSQFEHVEQFVSEQGWEVDSLSRTDGFYDQRVRPAQTTGTMHIAAHAVSYDRIFGVDMIVYWGFDDSGTLIDTWIWMTVDSL